jgi:hypothetical protein
MDEEETWRDKRGSVASGRVSTGESKRSIILMRDPTFVEL